MIILLLILSVRCASEKEKEAIPAHIIDEETFSDMMVEVLILEGYRSRNPKQKDSINVRLQQYYHGLIKEYGVSKEKFDQSYQYYSEDPARMKVIYDRVELKFKLKDDELSKQRQELRKDIDRKIENKADAN